MNIQLRWRGPYSVIEGTKLPCLFTSEDAAIGRPGVYLWTVERHAEEMVFYVGKTDESFRKRLWTEFRAVRRKRWDWIADPQERIRGIRRPDCWDWTPDAKLLRKGVRRWTYQPLGSKKPYMPAWIEKESVVDAAWRGFLKTIRIFITPTMGAVRRRKDIETALTWAVSDHEGSICKTDDDYFLSCTPARTLTYKYRIRSVAPVTFRGLSPVISGGPEI